MLVSDFISLVKEGSLNQTTVSEASIIKFINIGLIELFSKFNLNNPTEVITLVEGTDEYSLPDNFISVISITTSGKYFRDNLGVITPITNTIFDVPVNVQGDYNSVFINSKLILAVPLQVTGQTYTLVYKASPVTVTEQTLDEELEILPQYLEPLMLYVTYLGFMQNKGVADPDTRSAKTLYDNSILEIIDNGSYQSQYTLDTKFYNRGFV